MTILKSQVFRKTLPLFALLQISVLKSQSIENDTLTQNLQAPQVVVIEQKDRLLSQVPGAAAFIEPAKLRRIAPLTGNEVFRKISGIHVVDEEGIGLRMNLSIRGLDPDRSANVLVLEDGIPVQLNPYGEPELYYTPSIDRMAAVEVVKGSGQILFGPRTVGGVVNYITADAPASPETRLAVKGGTGGFVSTQIQHGNRVAGAGIVSNYLFKRADKIGTVAFDVHDFSTKINLPTGEKTALAFKFQMYKETSNSTYLGLTQTMFDAGNFYQIMAPDDRLDVRRAALSAIHKYFISNKLKLQTTAYAYSISRNWRRQIFSSSATAANQTGVIWGNPTVPKGAIFMQNQSGHRNRNFAVGGVESKLTFDYQFFQKKSQIEAGGRLVVEQAHEQELLGNSPKSESGVLIADERRPGRAASGFVQNKLVFNQKLSFTAGLRLENYHFERQIRMVKTAAGAYRDTNIVAPNSVAALIPGAGFNYILQKRVNVFGGVHRGFAPPAIKNSVSAAGQVFELEPQLSWNYELGFRAALPRGVDFELTGFLLDFQKQVIPVSESSGGAGSGFANGGRTLHVGAEGSLRLDFGKIFGSEHSIYLEANGTFSRATFASDRFVGGEKVNVRGNFLPYAPQWFSTQTLGWVAPTGLELQLTGNYVGEQFTDVLNSAAPAADGRSGKMPAYFLADATARQRLGRFVFFAACKNLFDERVLVSRRPTGIRVGVPRLVLCGVECRF